MHDFGIIAVTPSTFAESISNPSIAIAAARIGSIGIVDLEYIQPDDAIAAVNAVRSTSGCCGIKCGAVQIKELMPVLQALSSAPAHNVVLLSLSGLSKEAQLSAAVKQLHKLSLEVIVEAVTVAEAVMAEHAGADAVIAKGHESGGRVADETTFVLLQRCLRAVKLPVWAQGGIGLHTAAACYAAGAAGVVLDGQLLLTRESLLPPEVAAKIARMDGSETICLGDTSREAYRVYARHAGPDEGNGARAAENIRAAFTAAHADRLWPVGQDAAFAASLAQQFTSVSGIIQAVLQSVKEHLAQAAESRPVAEGAPLALAHRTQYPIVQGAMTRVSDTADFALSVSQGGGLPFLALALMRKAEIQKLLSECSDKLKSRSWGVGILGFVPEQLRKEQLEVIEEFKPPFALIAGGRPDQARALEGMGITTYLHVPSPLLLKSFIEMGSRRFIFEGKECGGHVGPRSSFVLWEAMIEALLASIGPRDDASAYQVLFAGGIHDHVSAAMVAAMAAPLAARGVKVGVLLGTAYLFTREAVESGAIVGKFQEAALNCNNTVLLETGPGHAIRCIESPYKKTFEDHRKKLEQQKKGRDEIREELELMNLGRLRLASKGLLREGRENDGLKTVAADKQWSEGMYMIGQVAALHDQVTSIADLHKDVSVSGTAHIDQLIAGRAMEPATVSKTQAKPEGIAIVGMSCLFPKASDLDAYWHNILNKVDAISEIPEDQWDWRNYYDSNPLARDKISSKWGGFLEPVSFDPTRYGIPPKSLSSIDPMQMLILEATRGAMEDAGYGRRPWSRERTSIILANAGHGPITAFYNLRSMLGWKLTDLTDQQKKNLEDSLPEWTEDSFPGYLSNVTAGRVANRFDLGGVNFCVDAACASSLAALYVAVSELRSGTSDVVLLAATDTHNQPGDYLSFSKTHALSQAGRCRTFDATADGIVISEGIAIMVLKRLSDAERDGDRIYAVVRGVGGSSDGKDLSLTAPRPEGQVLALERAYANAGISPATVELIEAHGTGTVAGDKAELAALKRVFSQAGAGKRYCAVGSVKSNIGHTKCAAGLASLIKIAKALHHKVLPPTIGVSTPNPNCDFENSPFYINSELRPWVHADADVPRRAGVSAFGFGGTNFHTVLEEYSGPERHHATRTWPSELFVWKAASKPELLRVVGAFEETMRKASGQPQNLPLSLLAYNTYLRYADRSANQEPCLAIVATSFEDLKEKISRAKTSLKEGAPEFKDPRGIYYSEQPADPKAKIALLFPGQGSQQVNMARDLAVHFPEARKSLEQAEGFLQGRFDRPLRSYIFPPPAFTEPESARQQQELTDTRIAQPAVGAVDVAMLNVLKAFGLQPDMVAGHSYGEYVALYCAGVLSAEDFFAVSADRGRILSQTNQQERGAMAAVAAEAGPVEALISKMTGVTVANINAPNQCIISGTQTSIDSAVTSLIQEGYNAKPIAVSAAFHSPYMEPARKVLQQALTNVRFSKPQIPVYSNTDCKPYGGEESVSERLCQHLVKPVKFMQQILSMHEDGARVFIECGPGAVLSNLVGTILESKPHLAIPADRSGRNGVTQLQHLLAQLIVLQKPLSLTALYRDRFQPLDECRQLEKQAEAANPRHPSMRYLVNSARIWKAETAAAPAAGKQASVPTASQVAAGGTAPARIAVAAAASGIPDTKKVAVGTANRSPVSSSPTTVAGGNGNGNGKQEALGLSSTMQKTGASPAVTTSQSAPKAAGYAAAPAVPPGSNGKVPANAGKPVAARSGVDQVVMQYQQTMLEMTNNFLQAQQNVMLAYLQSMSANGNGHSNGNGGALSQLAPEVVLSQLKMPQIVVPAVAQTGNGDHHLAAAAVEFEELQVPHQQTADPVSEPESNGSGTSAEVSADYLVDQFLEIVSQRTGYPPEMLDPTLDLEADLGIDSIKRVEILSSFRKILPEEKLREMEGGVEKLAATKTLQGIIDWIKTNNASASSPQGKSVEASSEPGATGVRRKGIISRGTINLVDLAQLPPAELSIDGTAIVIADEGGVFKQVLDKLKRLGVSTALVKNALSAGKEGDAYTADLLDYKQVEELVDTVLAEQGRIAGLLHLPSLDSKSDKAVGYASKTLFHLVKAFGAELKSRNGFVLSASRLGGGFGCEPSAQVSELEAQQAGTVGIIKSLAREWPEVSCKAVDFGRQQAADSIAESLVKELAAAKDCVEVGYYGGRRVGLDVAATPLSGASSAPLELDSSSVVLVTGGARGITAEVATELAKQYRPNLILAGRLPRPDARENSETEGLLSAKDIKAAIMERLRREGQAVSVAAVEAVYQKLMREREIRTSIAAMESFGSTVRYHSLDVRDEKALAALVDGIYETCGRIDGVIHGAGVIEDAWIQDKKPESFNRVFDTKVLPALTLSRCLQLDSLKFFYLFSSVVGRTGNAGQADYVAGNEVLNKLAVALNRKVSARVASLMWGPWNGGMAQPELESVFASHGWSMIEPADGRRSFMEELTSGAQESAEVLLVGQLEQDNREQPTGSAQAVRSALGARLHLSDIHANGDSTVEYTLTLDPEEDLYLKDHCFDGIPVLPMAMALELMVEAAASTYPQWRLAGVSNLDIPSGIMIDSGRKEVQVACKEKSRTADRLELSAWVKTADKIRFRAVIELAPAGSPVQVESLNPGEILNEVDPLPAVADAYKNWLFHGPVFQGIRSIEVMGSNGIVGDVSCSNPANCLQSAGAASWALDPILLDSSMQLAGIWARHFLDITVLPSGFRRLRLLGPLTGKVLRAQINVPADLHEGELICDLVLYSDGKPSLLVEGLAGIGSKSFNRFAGASREVGSVR